MRVLHPAGDRRRIDGDRAIIAGADRVRFQGALSGRDAVIEAEQDVPAGH